MLPPAFESQIPSPGAPVEFRIRIPPSPRGRRSNLEFESQPAAGSRRIRISNPKFDPKFEFDQNSTKNPDSIGSTRPCMVLRDLDRSEGRNSDRWLGPYIALVLSVNSCVVRLLGVWVGTAALHQTRGGLEQLVCLERSGKKWHDTPTHMLATAPALHFTFYFYFSFFFFSPRRAQQRRQRAFCGVGESTASPRRDCVGNTKSRRYYPRKRVCISAEARTAQ